MTAQGVAMEIKAVVVDVDGTLTDRNKVMFTSGIEALRRVQERGVPVSIASGNVLPVAYGLSTYLGLGGPIIAENGGIVSYREEIYELFSRDLPDRALEHLRRNMEVEELFTSHWRRTEVGLRRSVDIGRVRELLRDWDVVVECTGFAIHIMNPGHGKGAGVRRMAELLGISTKDVAAFGDADNDVSMFRECGHSVAVGSASPAAKAAAGYVSPYDHAEGVIDGLTQLGLL